MERPNYAAGTFVSHSLRDGPVRKFISELRNTLLIHWLLKLQHHKTNKFSCVPSEDWSSWASAVLSVFAVHLKVAEGLCYLNAGSEDFDRPGRMLRLICAFVALTCQFVGFVVSRLSCFIDNSCLSFCRTACDWFQISMSLTEKSINNWVCGTSIGIGSWTRLCLYCKPY